MATYRVDADAAFTRLRQQWRISNLKLRDVATEIVRPNANS